VETAIVLPLLFLLLFGIVDFGRLVAANSAVNTASRESTRFGSSVGLSVNSVPRYVDCDEIIDAGLRLSSMASLQPGSFTVEYDHGPGTAVFLSCPAGGPTPDPAQISDGDRIIVTTSEQFNFITPMIGQFFGTVTAESVDRRTIYSP
jgi:hypothetical protein